MHIYAKQLSAFLTMAKYKAILIYGPEDAIVYSSLKAVLDHALKLYPEAEQINIAYNEIKDAPMQLVDEMRSVSLFTQQKIIVVEHCSTSCSKELIKILQEAISVELLIFIAGDLGKSSALRQTFEALEYGVAVACYKPDTAALQQHIHAMITQMGLKCEAGVAEILVNIMPPNPMLIDQELQKLQLYKNGETVTVNDIARVYENAAELSLDDLCLAIINRDARNLVRALARIEYHDTNFMLIIRVLMGFCMRLLTVKEKMATGSNAQQAIAQLKPPVFFKQRDNMMLAARNWSTIQAQTLLTQVLQLETRCKSTGLPPELLLRSTLLELVS